MALAAFFSRAAQGAAQVLRSFDEEAFAAQLNAEVVGIEFDAQAADTLEGRATLDLLVRLLARLYPRLAILGGENADLQAQLRELATAINPLIDLVEGAGQVTISVCVGQTPSRAPRVIYAGSDGWVARVRISGPVGCGGTANPFGAGAAACLAAANVFRAIFAESLDAGQADHDACISLLDFTTGETATSKPSLGEIPLGSLHLVGCGAIGNGTLWALSRVPQLSGRVELIDPELIELSNLQRYVLTTDGEIGTVKVDLARRILEREGLEVVAFQGSWADYLAQRANWQLERVAVALDTARDRIAVQASLPRWVANAWTQVGDLGVSRHRFVGEGACMACLYLPQGEVQSEDTIITGALGMPADQVMRVRELLYKGAPVGEEFAREIASYLDLPPELLAPFAHEPLRAFYTRGICGSASLRLKNSPAVATDVPMAFQSALAGLMLAAEVVVDCGGYRGQHLPAKTTVDLMRPLGALLSMNVAKPAPGAGPRCICQDGEYLQRYEQKYG